MVEKRRWTLWLFFLHPAINTQKPRPKWLSEPNNSCCKRQHTECIVNFRRSFSSILSLFHAKSQPNSISFLQRSFWSSFEVQFWSMLDMLKGLIFRLFFLHLATNTQEWLSEWNNSNCKRQNTESTLIFVRFTSKKLL